MLNDILNDAENGMQKKLEGLENELGKMRTGRAHPGLIEQVKVPYYGGDVPLSQVASINVSDPRTLSVTPWEKNLLKAIEKAIASAGLGLNPIGDANLVRVPMPALTEERRKELVKVMRNEGEQSRINVRNVRRDANNSLKKLVKDKEISDDEERRGQEHVQKVTDKIIAEIDQMLKDKETELMKV